MRKSDMEIPKNSNKNFLTISGDIGSGKSVVGIAVAKALVYDYLSSGAIAREVAVKHGMTILELNQYAETHPEIDYEIDDRIAEIGRTRSGLVVDSRMAWHFIPHSFKIFLACSVSEAARRIASAGRSHEQYESQQVAEQQIAARRASEVKRFREFYQVDLGAHSNFDLVIDTVGRTPEQVVAIALQNVRTKI
jgi:CMP/dCMP kinase